MNLYYMTNSANQNSSFNQEGEHMASIKIPTVILFNKHTALYILLHTKFGITVKGHSAQFCIFLVTLKTNLRYFIQHWWMFTFWVQHWLRHSTSVADDFTIWRIDQNLSKNSSGTVTLCYHVNLVIDIPNITENDINSHFFSCHHWVFQK